MPEALKQIFLENLSQTMVLPVGQSTIFEAMYWFGQEMTGAAVMVVLASTLGCVFNWIFGQVLAFIRLQNKAFLPDERYNRIGSIARRYGMFLLPFYWIPLGGVLVVAAGFFGLRWWQVALMTALGALLRLYLYFPAVFGGTV